MANLPVAVDYTDRDFEALRLRVFDLVRSVFPNWSDDTVANFANLLVEAHCFIGDVLGYYEDRLGREGRFAWATQRRSMIALCKLIGYTLPGASAAGCDLVLTVQNAAALTGHVVPSSPSTPVVVATRTVTSPVKGEIMDPIDIDVGGGATQLTVAWEHSITQGPYAIASMGRPDQEVLLPFGPFLDDGSEIIFTPTQPVWTRVDTFLFSGPTDCHYRIEVDQNDLATIIFGDGLNGAIPVGNVVYRWRSGGGVSGDVEPNSLTKFSAGSFIDDLGHTAEVTVTNPLKASGGAPREEVEGARVNAPLSFRTSDRTVSRDDYEINAMRVPGVGRTLMLTSNEDSGIDENTGQLYVLPKAGGVAPQTMLDDVYTMCKVTRPCTITFTLETRSAVYLDVNVHAVVWLREGYDTAAKKAIVRAAIQTDLEDWFEPLLASGAPNETVDFGFNYKDEDGNPAGEIAWSDIFDVVKDVPQVRKVGSGSTEFTLNGLHDDVSIPNHMFPRLGTVTIVDGHTGTAF